MPKRREKIRRSMDYFLHQPGDTMTAYEVAEVLGMSPKSVYAHARAGLLPVIVPAAPFRFPKAKIAELCPPVEARYAQKGGE